MLPNIFKEPKVILDVVRSELCKNRNYQTYFTNLVSFGLIQEITFSNDLRILQEYARLKKTFGDGESACMAYCKHHKDILASSNLRDIKDYCTEHAIEYLTTMDFLYEAFQTALMDEAACDYFIYEVKSQGSKLPVDTIKAYQALKAKESRK